MKTEATQLNNFIQKLAHFLSDNKPAFVDRYAVRVSTFKKGEVHVIRFVSEFELNQKELVNLEKAKVIEDEQS